MTFLIHSPSERSSSSGSLDRWNGARKKRIILRHSAPYVAMQKSLGCEVKKTHWRKLQKHTGKKYKGEKDVRHKMGALKTTPRASYKT